MNDMKKNVVILTGGLSGSSVLAGLIARAGYWLGNETTKVKYNTFENSKLVKLNIELFRKSGYLWRGIDDIPPPSIDRILEESRNLDLTKYQQFIEECNTHKPWLWKDPRLSYTMFFWKKLIDYKSCKYILITRDPKQTWTGIVIRGKSAVPYDKLGNIQQSCFNASHRFIKQEGLEHFIMTFEDLILHPDESLSDINGFLETNLDIEDFKAIYKGQLYRKRWSQFDYFKAKMIFSYYKYILRTIVEFPRVTKSD